MNFFPSVNRFTPPDRSLNYSTARGRTGRPCEKCRLTRVWIFAGRIAGVHMTGTTDLDLLYLYDGDMNWAASTALISVQRSAELHIMSPSHNGRWASAARARLAGTAERPTQRDRRFPDALPKRAVVRQTASQRLRKSPDTRHAFSPGTGVLDERSPTRTLITTVAQRKKGEHQCRHHLGKRLRI